jgi:E1A/CREB-binding protein
VFQEIDAVDVMLFGLYVYEHDEKNPKPNSRCVYVSYLDSVHYMQPRKIRTFIYHEILISYLDYVRQRGFATAHIWACPPLKGDDYILYAKPEDQRTPKDQQLRQWYIDMLDVCKDRGVVKSVTNMHELYFNDPKNDATIIPYLEGDYWVGEAENIIKELEDGGKKGKKGDASKRKGIKAQGGNNSRGGTRSTGLDEDALIASGIIDPPPKSLEDGGKDILMQKLGETIQPMKDSFIVAYLNWEESTEVRDKEVAIERKEQEKIEAEKKKKEEAAAAKKAAADKKKKEAEEKKAAAEKKKQEEEDKKKKKEEESKAAKEEDEGDSTKVKKEKEEGSDKMDAEETEKPAAASRKSTRGQRGKKKGGDEEEKEAVKKEEEDAMDVDEKEKETPSKRGARKGARNAKKKVDEKDEEDKKEVKDEKEENVKEEEGEKVEGETGGGKKRDRDGNVIEEDSAGNDEVKQEEENKPEPKSEEEIKKEKELAEEEVFLKTWTKQKAKEYYQERLDSEKERLESGETTLAILPNKLRDPRTGRMCDVLDDDSETMDCEHLNSRQQFLNLCQGNHYQNNTLRNAKHTSMMVLWHLHNREAPKFVQQCSKCNREILLGYRYHCNVCNDYDVCQDCMHTTMKDQPHWHTLTPIRIKEEEATEKQKKERARSIQLHMQLLAHAAACASPDCPSANCSKMKGLLEHGKTCQKQAKGGCHVCKRIWALLQLHARQCKNNNCKVPSCNVIRENARRIMLQQQAMDDRRRMMMNQSYAVKR